jgi:hypothetical protein
MTTASDGPRAQTVTRHEEELADGFTDATGFFTFSASDGDEPEGTRGEIDQAS